mgnify:CR=1 FL=1
MGGGVILMGEPILRLFDFTPEGAVYAKKILVVVSGEDKAEAVKKSFFGPITPAVPGSILQLHNDVVVVADEAALSLCEGLY